MLPLFLAALAPSAPDPREIPLPPIATRFASLPGPNALPDRPDLPDFLTFNDGSKVQSLADWERRRAEMRDILSYYAIGHMPPPPGNVAGATLRTQPVLDGQATYRLVRLSFGPERSLHLDIGIFTPAGSGPFPAII